MKLHLFNPENDLALGLGCRNYTPPPHAAAIHRAGALLPLWWAGEDDLVIAPEGLAAYAGQLKERFGLHGNIFTGQPVKATPAPWGWSADAKRQFTVAGVRPETLPSDEMIGRLRLLSHRRMTIEIIEGLGGDCPVPTEATDPEAVVEAERLSPGCFIKSPWSGSGRGVFCARSLDEKALYKRAAGIINRQGSVMVERGLDKELDFAALFHAEGGRVCFKGWSVFKAESRGMYSGNIVAPQSRLHEIICGYLPAEMLADTISREEEILSRLAGGSYEGWLGIDMMVYRENGEMKLMPCVEMNLRMTMGVAAMKIGEKLSLQTPALLAWRHRADEADLEGSTILLPPSDGFALTLTEIGEPAQ